MEKWNGRVALVTGASVGIGAAICKALVQSGVKVIGTARRLEKIEDLSKELKGEKGSLMGIKCDVTKDEEVYALFETVKQKCGGVDICINNAGMSANNSLLDGSPDEWHQMMDVNVISVCLFTKLSIASMRERAVDDGHIINVSSMSAYRLAAKSNTTHFYAATKYALRAISEGLRQELRQLKSHIRISSISPGVVETEFARTMLKDEEEANALYASMKCLKAEDIAATALHILSAPSHVEINDVLLRPTEQAS